MKSPLLLAALAGGAYFLTKKKAPATTTTNPPSNKPENKYESKKEEDTEEESKEEKLPPVEEDKPNTEDNKDEDIEDVDLSDFYEPVLQNKNQSPLIMDPKTIWISDDCMSWAVGKEYKVELPEKYVYVDTKTPDVMVTPWQWWSKIGGNISPSPWYLNNLSSDTPARAFAANLVDYWNKCDISPPRRKQFLNYGEYRLMMNKFVETPLGKLFSYLVDRINNEMYTPWEIKYPDKALLETFKGYALSAVIKYPKESTTKQTDIAYAWTFADDPDAPKKIDIKNPAHKQYLLYWQRINIEVKNYVGLIKQYGL